MTDRILAGKCFCGAVQYAVADDFLYAMNCHCSNCRRTTGSAFKPFAGIERDKLAVTQGADGLLIYGGDKAPRRPLRRCGSLLYSVVRDGAYVHVAMGTWSTTRPSGRRATSSSARRRRGSPSPTTCRSTRGMCRASNGFHPSSRLRQRFALAILVNEPSILEFVYDRDGRICCRSVPFSL